MMQFDCTLPTRIFFGAGCLQRQAGLFPFLGKKALLVTGKASAAENGSLEDVCRALAEAGVAWVHFPGVEPDPGFDTVA
ncbi:iron-containing alcohol dehydrogenase, partial [candidate division FCPU426 bacterium]|nr:iron-containing alcohol dehydrogenase [candidate division FCPU426 bacterium]